MGIQNNNRIIGYELLRIVLSFFIVMSHFWRWDPDSEVDIIVVTIRNMAVPTFMSMAFFFSSSLFTNKGLEALLRREKRLVIPFVFWGVAGYVLMNLGYYCIERKVRFDVFDLLRQLLFGDTDINGVLWFQFDLMLLTFFFWVGFVTIKVHRELMVITIGIIAEVCVMVGLNYKLNMYLIDRQMGGPSLARLCKMIPYAVIGILMGGRTKVSTRWLELNIWFKTITIISIGLACLLVRQYEIKSDIINFGYGYPSQLIGSIGILLLFLGIDITNEKLKKLVSIISSYSMGIYCSHMIFGNVLKRVFLLLEPNIVDTVWFCFWVWIISLFGAILISKMPLLEKTVR